jgi:hypothetical protein
VRHGENNSEFRYDLKSKPILVRRRSIQSLFQDPFEQNPNLITRELVTSEGHLEP